MTRRASRPPRPPRLNADGRFVCPHHAGDLTLSPASCARLYRRGQDATRLADAAERASVGPCMGCGIGAVHAGALPAAVAPAPLFLPGQGLLSVPVEERQRRGRIGAISSRDEVLARKARDARRTREPRGNA